MTATQLAPESLLPALPQPPRPITRAARRRSWAEQPVRLWVILTTVVVLITIYFTATRIQEARNDRRLIIGGLPVEAKFERVNGDPVPKRRPRNEAMPCVVSFNVNGKKYTSDIMLPAQPGGFAMVGTNFSIKVDPDDPNRWTEQTEPQPWTQELTVSALLAPLCALLLIVTLLRRRSMLDVWRHGVLSSAAVTEVRHSAVAPRSRVVRFSVDDPQDRRIRTLLWPTAAQIPVPGQTFPVLRRSTRSPLAVLPQLYQS